MCLFLFLALCFNIQLNRESEFNEMAAWLDHTVSLYNSKTKTNPFPTLLYKIKINIHLLSDVI